ncbi:hypothetical protein G7Y89_g13806 [Cudoniella acicularis]|uniref:Cyanovirin-N domain-containing protein n=1 Tax=Cudoniella acicularis TaxID=354080 RepID=A0A8H4R6J0_9HELO|nr:hypothetical protein G7Y89_g13806 [Cudoniella acicularis]
MQFSSIIFLASLAAPAIVTAGPIIQNQKRSGGWFESCLYSTLDYYVLNTDCGSFHPQIDLNLYIVNTNGEMSVGGGGFGSSCDGCSLASAVLNCNCADANGNKSPVGLNLDASLAYDGNGHLLFN